MRYQYGVQVQTGKTWAWIRPDLRATNAPMEAASWDHEADAETAAKFLSSKLPTRTLRVSRKPVTPRA